MLLNQQTPVSPLICAINQTGERHQLSSTLPSPTVMASATDFSNISGPPFLGFCLNLLLCGILIVQVYLYYVGFPNDRLHLKALVYSIFVLEIIQTSILCYDKFDLYARDFGNPEALLENRNAWFAIPVLTAFTSGIVQAFFGYRIFTFSNSWIAAILVWAITLLQTGSGIAQGALSFHLTMVEVGQLTETTLVTWFVSSAVNDVLIAILLSTYLNRLKNGSEKTDAVLTRIIRMVVETGTLTAILAVLVVLLFFVCPPWFLLVSDSIGKVYANNIMVMFNRRLQLTSGEPNPSSITSRNFHGITSGNRGERTPNVLTPITGAWNHPIQMKATPCGALEEGSGSKGW